MVDEKEEGRRDGLVTESEFLLPSGMGRVVRSDTIVLSRDTKVYRSSYVVSEWGGQECTVTYLTCGSGGSGSEDGGRIRVYKAANTSSSAFYESGGRLSCHSFVSKTFDALKVSSNPDSIQRMKQDLRRNLQARAHRYPIDLMRVVENFVDETSGEFCLAITPFPEHGSMRTIMKRMNSGTGGFPEDLILCALRTVLRGLAPLHNQGILHSDINAGRLYLGYDRTHGTPVITLAFGAATIDIVDHSNTSSFNALPLASMSHWAAAPEVYDCPSSAAADVWLVGITALELACGEALFKITNREALEAIIKHIHRTHQLPSPTPSHSNSSIFPTSSSDALHDDNAASLSSSAPTSIDHQTHGKKVNSVLKHFVRTLLLSVPRPAAAHSPVPFSKNFTKMVIKCLAWDPKKRPTVAALLSQKFFKTEFPQDDSTYFYDHVKNYLT
ncbi:unnamed protein product [Cuscuta epithymum]|uniref:Protein kinase domain-containing protein n=1 Tax=Cuscuta epithymum TaxID=186058 RepID=A0AAV0C3B5_9ASTE|nr:unnamed protein product [Cuscuta epithymum]CAH9136349.1 unnamed protein product [Cuscuta epithymum]